MFDTIHKIFKCNSGPSTPPSLIIFDEAGRALLTIHTNGTVEGEFEDASEAARVFVEHLRGLLRQPTHSEPEAMRYGFDGFGYKYIDSGSGGDWRTRHPDAEPLYT